MPTSLSPCVTVLIIVATVGRAPLAWAQSVSDSRVAGLVERALAQTQPPAGSSQPSVALTLDEAVERALARNLDIAVERLNPPAFDLSIAQLNAGYRPSVSALFGTASRTQPGSSQLVGGAAVETDTDTFNSGLAQNVPWGGGRFSFDWTGNRVESSNLFSNFSPAYNTSLTAAYTQPLLQGFGIDNIRQQLRVTRINRDVSEIQLRASITNTLANVRNAYWDYVFAVEAVDVARRSLQLAEKLVEDNRVRVEVGTLAPIEIVQAQAEAAARRQTLAQAEATRRTAELGLKRLIVDGTGDPLWRASVTPVDRPTFQPEPVDIERAVRSAIEKRTDLRQAARQVEANEVTLRYFRNLTLPAVDLVASYGATGLGGVRTLRGGLGSGDVLQTIPGGFTDSVNTLVDRDFTNWNVSVNITYPLGTNAAEAQHARARLQLQQTQAQIRALELQVATEVTNIAVQVQSSQEQVQAAMVARELSQRRLEAEQSRFEVGLSTNFLVVQAQRDLAAAQNAELRALLDYRKSLVDFERVQETTLSRAGVTLISGGPGGAGATGATGAFSQGQTGTFGAGQRGETGRPQ